VIGISVYQSFEDATDGEVPMPVTGEALLGGHAICLVGYDSAHVTFRNSWGAGWGKEGYGTLPWAYVLSADLASDLWVVKSVE
jgi:C1A family cysteine protease